MSFTCCFALFLRFHVVGFHFMCLEFMTEPLNLQLSMEAPKIASLWGALRSCGFESLAPTLVGLGITSLNDITFHSGDLGAAGIAQWQIEALIASRTPKDSRESKASAGRPDHPVPYDGRRASLAMALEAAVPNNRKRSLDALEADVLSRSTTPSQESKVRTYLALCAAWEVDPWPVSPTNVRCVAASFKHGGYRSAAGYFQAVMGYQQRHLRASVDNLTKRCIKDSVRSIRRGLGSHHLKDSFDAHLLGDAPANDDTKPFDFEDISHLRDMCVLSVWFMLRETEVSNAKMSDLQLEMNEVRLMVAIHKTDSYGTMTSRTLRCCCRVRQSGMCPWHAGERHLVRLSLHPRLTRSHHLPLFPTAQGMAPSKYMVIQAFRRVIATTGTATMRRDPQGRELQRFAGHVMRVAGAQMLASSGVPVQLIQLLGRWTSQAVMRYVQEAHLVQLPSLPSAVIGNQSHDRHPGTLSQAVPATPVRQEQVAVVDKPNEDQEARPSQQAPSVDPEVVRKLQAQIDVIQQAIQKPTQAFVARHRGRVLHVGMLEELHTPPAHWRTKCGWGYGLTNFVRLSEDYPGTRRCQKCFEISADHDSESESDSSSMSSSSGSEDDS